MSNKLTEACIAYYNLKEIKIFTVKDFGKTRRDITFNSDNNLFLYNTETKIFYKNEMHRGIMQLCKCIVNNEADVLKALKDYFETGKGSKLKKKPIIGEIK